MRLTVPPHPGVRTAVLICARMLLLVGLVFAVDRAFADDKVFRCGNRDQDRHCASTSNEAARPAATQETRSSTGDEVSKPVAIAAARPASRTIVSPSMTQAA